MLSFHMTQPDLFRFSGLPIKGGLGSSHMIFISATRNLVWGYVEDDFISVSVSVIRFLALLTTNSSRKGYHEDEIRYQNTYQIINTEERDEPHANNLAIALQTETTGKTRKQSHPQNIIITHRPK